MNEDRTNTTRSEALQKLINNLNNNYVHWDKFKDMQLPLDASHEEIWQQAISERQQGNTRKLTIENISINWWLSNTMEAQLHKLDIGLAGGLGMDVLLAPKYVHRHKTNMLLDESITSSLLAGAIVPKKAAREMLLKKRSPQNKDEQVCINIFRALQLSISKKEQPLTQDLLFQIHQTLTKDTIKLKGIGNYRTNIKIDTSSIDTSAGYKPVEATLVPQLMNLVFDFYNNDTEPFFIHPLVKASIIHYLITSFRPFKDANGRMARLLAQMYLLKKEYWVTEFISVSNIISKFKPKYHKAIALSQADGNNIGYFLQFYIQSLQMAHKSLKDFVQRINKERTEKASPKRSGYNDRQTTVLQWLKDDAEKIVTIRELRSVYGVSKETARTDLTALVEKGWLKYYNINKKTYAFVKGDSFDALILQ